MLGPSLKRCWLRRSCRVPVLRSWFAICEPSLLTVLVRHRVGVQRNPYLESRILTSYGCAGGASSSYAGATPLAASPPEGHRPSHRCGWKGLDRAGRRRTEPNRRPPRSASCGAARWTRGRSPDRCMTGLGIWSGWPSARSPPVTGPRLPSLCSRPGRSGSTFERSRCCTRWPTSRGGAGCPIPTAADVRNLDVRNGTDSPSGRSRHSISSRMDAPTTRSLPSCSSHQRRRASTSPTSSPSST